MQNKHVVPKHRKIADQLRLQIQDGVLKAGDAIPPYRDLMSTHGVTVGVVRQAMQTLHAEGLIDSIPRVGCRVAARSKKWRLVGVVIPGYGTSAYHLEQIKQVHDKFESVQCDVAIRFVESLDEPSLKACIEWAGRLDGVLMIGRVSLQLAQRLLAARVPTVQIGELIDAPIPTGLNAVSIDVPSMVRMAVNHLISCGHRRIAFYSGHGTRYYEILSQTFEACMREHGLATQGIELAEPGKVRSEPPEAFQRLQALAEPPTAILAEEGVYASDMIRLLNFKGWPVPERISVIAITATAQPPWVMENLTCVLSSTHELLARAVEMMNDLLSGLESTVRVERLIPAFVPGKTCRTLVP